MKRSHLPAALLTSVALCLVASGASADEPTSAQQSPHLSDTGASAAPGEAPLRRQPRGRAIPDQYIVVFKDHVRDVRSRADRLTRAHGGRRLHVYQHALKGFAAKLPPQAIAALRRDPDIAVIEEDGLVLPDVTVQPGATWGLDRVDQRDLPLSTTYSYATSGTGVRAYVIDSGIRSGHAEFGGRAALGADFVGDGVGAGTGDCNGHGTHVAGTIGGTTYGVAKDVTLISVRIFGCAGGSPRSRSIAAVDWVTANGTRPAVVNMSLGGSNEGFPGLSALDQAVESSIDQGFVYAVAAGNDHGRNACEKTPARAPSALTVASSTSADARSGFSNTGSCVDLFAPGSGITSAWSTSNTDVATISGTSMATPHVAGAAALLLQRTPSASPAAVGSVVLSSATSGRLTDIGTGSPDLLLHTLSARLAVGIDIKPGSSPNSISLRDRGLLPVAVLTTPSFDATQVDASTLTSGDEDGTETAVARRRNGTAMAALEDVDADGDRDLVVQFSVPALVANGDLDAQSTGLVLLGNLRSSTPIRGADAVRIVR